MTLVLILGKSKAMDYIDLEIVNSLLLESPDIFKPYFTDLLETTDNHQKATEIFKRYGYPGPFDEFLTKYRQWCEDKKKFQEDKSTQTSSNEKSAETSSQEMSPEIPKSVDQEIIEEPAKGKQFIQFISESPTRRNFESAFRHSVFVVPPQRTRKKEKEVFDIAEFLVKKKRNDEAVSLTFLADDDVQEELASSDTREKEKMSLLMNGFLRKIADLIELLNLTFNYRVLHIHYDSFGIID